MEQSFTVDLTNPSEIHEKLPQIRSLLVRKRQELAALQEQVNLLARLVGPERPVATNGTVPKASTPRTKNKRPTRRDRAVEALERAGRPMGPTELHHFMLREGMEASPNANALGAALWAAADAGRIIGEDGVYRPKDRGDARQSPLVPTPPSTALVATNSIGGPDPDG